jgi:NAD(P)-dependent dehydrogenase (short-subunit alcohol dehydrogenase family)
MMQNDKRALVFGGTSGIGLATALLLAERGASVTVVGPEDLRPNILRDDSAVHWIHGDVSNANDVAAAVADATAKGPLDWLVYSAGIQRYGTVVETSVEEWDLVQSVNARGAFLTAHFALPRTQRGGAVVLVSSVQGLSCQTGVAAYAASKGTLDALTRAMALDHAPDGIRVNAVLPGTVDTPMARASANLFRGQSSADDVIAGWGRLHPLGRVAQPREIAQAVAFLLSDEASFITGTMLTIDGGLLAQLSVKL